MTDVKKVIYRGTSMIETWPEKIRKAQSITSYRLDGKNFPRVPYGSEADDWGADKYPCHDCRVIKGEFHVPDCDAEECPSCGGQLISCDCAFDDIASSTEL